MGGKAKKGRAKLLALDDLVVERVVAYRVTLRGVPVSGIKETRAEAEGYKERTFERNGDALLVMIGDQSVNGGTPKKPLDQKRKRGGPYEYTLPDGKKGEAHVDSIKQAKELICRKLGGRKRVPKGTIIKPMR